jgi:hypothetical protein
LARRAAILAALVISLSLPVAAQANGDPASDYLLTQKVFLPFGAKIDSDAAEGLNTLLEAAAKDKFPIRVAVISTPQDLGTAFSLYNKPQRYAEFLGLELSFVYRDPLLIVMPKGFGYSVNGNPDPKNAQVLNALPPPGRAATKEVEAATVAVRRLAAAAGHEIVVEGSSSAKDRIMIALGATAGVALLAGFLLYRRRRRTLQA